MQVAIEVIIALLPIAVLFIGFLVFRLSAFMASFYAWVLELVVVLVYYQQPPLKVVEASLWGIITIWSGFLVLYTGQLFGQSYRSTGLLAVLLNSVGSLVPAYDKQAQALALVVVIGGFIGAFNGFAVYPVAIPGLIELGFDAVATITSFLVYFAWPQPFVSLFIVPNISNVATHVPIPDIARAAGVVGIPLVFVSILGFIKLLGFRFFSARTQFLFWSMSLSNVSALILFTQIWPQYGIFTLIAGAAISLVVLYVYGRVKVMPAPETGAASPAPAHAYSAGTQLRAYAPLLLGVAIVVASLLPGAKPALGHLAFKVGAWGYKPISINIFTSAGFFVFITALVCYPFARQRASVAKDFWTATKRARASLLTLAVGSALVYLLVDTGQIQLLARVLSDGGRDAYAWLSPLMESLGGMAFGQGLPADFLLASMQTPVAPLLGIPLAVLVGIVTVMSEGPPNPLKPTQIAYTQSLANVTGKDGEIFRITLKWQVLSLVTATIVAAVLVYFS
ncbi:MAG TPA: L-lactate permease [Xanthobacteraceae bacterium]|nr:L-lactate permease [Xanthobacteraceae bacterium]